MDASKQETVKIALSADGGAILDYIARDNDVSLADVISCLPVEQAQTIAGDKFNQVMMEISGWGEITFLVHTADIVLEVKGELPTGSEGRGFYNLHGKPIGGHLKGENCSTISFVSRPVFKNDAHSVQFFNKDGGCMFKIYLGRDDERQLIPAQVEKFKNYRDKMTG